jgi:hypothetical protein
MGTLWRITKDGLKAFVVWMIIFSGLTFFFGDIGRVLGLLVGLIFVVSFFALRFTEILNFILSRGRGPRQSQSNVPPAPPRSSAPPPPVEPTYCPKCGSAWVPGARICANCG